MTKSVKLLELDKILAAAAEYAVLEGGAISVNATEPTSDLSEARRRLDMTEEALRLLSLSAITVSYFPPLGDSLERAEKGSTLTCRELLDARLLLESARLCEKSICSAEAEGGIYELAVRLVGDERLAEDIGSKIEAEDKIADRASETLYEIRKSIRALNERIRARLAEYLTGDERKFLQEGIVTMRGDRYVLPVKAEYKRSMRGFIHDRSQSGATVFIEPEEVLEMNNELVTLSIDEKEEEERILAALSRRIGELRAPLEQDIALLQEIDGFRARAIYCERTHSVKPIINGNGAVKIIKGIHPLLDKKSAVPVSVEVGQDYRFLLVSGANTGGKTVTLKMCGLFCLMAACGLYVPAAEGTRLSVFDEIFCDIGDSQSIEENLSTFSSHIVNIKDILARAGARSFVLIDEPGGGTDPEEGQALARAVLSALKKAGCRGIVTTHYSALKEFAFETEGMENGSMEFDAGTLRPLYRLKIGQPGSSNALAICARLGVPEEVLAEARGWLSEGSRAFERTVRAAEESRIAADGVRADAERVKREWETRLAELEKEEEKFKRERERFLTSSKAEARRIVNERTAEAEALLQEIEGIFAKESLAESDLIRARTLKNRMEGSAFVAEEEKIRKLPVDGNSLKAGDKVFVKSMGREGVVLSYRKEKGAVELQCGSIRVKSKLSDLFISGKETEKKSEKVRVVRNVSPAQIPKRECNIIGMTVQEALPEVENFLDAALVSGLAEVRIVHGMGMGKLRAAVHQLLRTHKRVKDYRLGVYGEGESGVTIASLE